MGGEDQDDLDGLHWLRRLQAIGCGILGWTPAVFWASTHHELMDAVDGWKQANGVRDAKSETWAEWHERTFGTPPE